MNELHENLLYVRSLLLAMQRLNQEEQGLLNQIQEPVRAWNRAVSSPQKKYTEYSKGKVVSIILGLFLAMELIGICQTAGRVRQDLKNEVFLSTEDVKYEDVTVSETEVYTKAALRSLPMSVIEAAIIGGVVVLANRSKVVKAKKQMELDKKRIENQNLNVREKNYDIQRRNQAIAAEVENIHSRKYMVSQEYQQNVLTWFPRDYGYLSAVDYFINLVENHLVSNIQEAVKEYNTYMHRKKTLENQETMLEYGREMLSKQDRLIKEQMLGNLLNAANLAANIGNGRRLDNIERTTARGASAAERAASAAESAASAARNINDKLRW